MQRRKVMSLDSIRSMIPESLFPWYAQQMMCNCSDFARVGPTCTLFLTYGVRLHHLKDPLVNASYKYVEIPFALEFDQDYTITYV